MIEDDLTEKYRRIPCKDGWNAKCAMFIRRTKQADYEARQLAKYNESMGIKP